MAGLIDKNAELARIDKGIEKKSKDIERIEAKLNNPKFVDKAPQEVVEKERAQLADGKQTLVTMQEHREKIATL